MPIAKSISKIHLETTLFSSFPLLASQSGPSPSPIPMYNTLLACHSVSPLVWLQSVLHTAAEVIILKHKCSNTSLLLNFISGFPRHSETTTENTKLFTMNCKALHVLLRLCFQPQSHATGLCPLCCSF